MPADVERLLRIIAPAFVLLAGCDAKEGTSKAEVVAKAPVDLGAAAIADDDEAPVLSPESSAPDVGEATPPKLDLPPIVADPKLVVEEPPKPKVVIPGTARPERRPTPTCPSGTWCTDKASANKHAMAGAGSSQGCPSSITGGAKGLDEPAPVGEMRGLDEAATKAKRAEGSKDACCYGWFRRCPGGRPLLDDAGAPVVAAFETGHAPRWSCDREALPASAQARAFAAQAWLDDAAMEHASVASFGRVALELLSLGAPPELVEGAHLAALDEVRHARTCLSLARACGAEEVEPGPLAAVPQRSADYARFAADTFIEGCVGETVAALVVTRAAARAEDAAVRHALEEIATDEARHAALAWRMVSWAIERGGAPVLTAVLQAADQLRDTADVPAGSEPEGIERLGRLGARELSQARRDGWTGIIEPMLTRLRHPPIA